MYVQGAVLGVTADREEDYTELARQMGEMMREYGAIEVIENWEVDVPDGENTDFRRAVAAKDNEKIVFSWVTWPSKEFFDEAHEKMMQDERMQTMPENLPFEGKRMVYGGFRTIYSNRAGD